MRRLFAVVLIVLAANPQAAFGQPFKMEPGPKSPADSLKCIQTRPGFTVELMASEPLVKSPIAFAWGPDGKFWVVEMGDYPLGVDGKGKGGGKIKFLEKTKPGDGPYDKMTVFMDGLPFPTGVTPYGKGVLVTCAPDIFYAEDTDGDGKADKKEILFTGFREGNQQHRVNGLVWGLDNWFYGANGDSGGKVKSIKTGKVVDINGRDFRLKPDTGEFEAVTGQTQFGRCRDDWGNWFGNNNSNPLFHFVLEDRYLKRNPLLLPPDPRVNVSVNPGASEVFPISKPLPRFNSPQALNHFTSACSAIIYRDDLFGPEFVGNSFVSEPVHNLIHREIVTPKGVTFTSKRADDEQKSEFLASSDNWFRPTTIATGPDGAIWIADMYRYVIEHPEWIPKDWQAKLDLRAGHELGRIYRVYPKNKKPREIVRMDSMPEIINAIASPNGWTRDMAQQILVRTKAKNPAVLTKLLLKLLREAEPLGRLHALCTLDGMGQLDISTAITVFQDKHAALRKHAIRCVEVFVESNDDHAWFDAVQRAKLSKPTEPVTDPDRQVRLQLAYLVGAKESKFWARVLIKLLRENADDRFIVAAAMSSIHGKTAPAVFEALAEVPNLPPSLVGPLVRLAKEHGLSGAAGRLLLTFPTAGKGISDKEKFQNVAALLDDLGTVGTPLSQLFPKQTEGDPLDQLRVVHSASRKAVVNSKTELATRKAAVGLLARGIGNDGEDREILVGLLTPQVPDEIQAAAIQALGRNNDRAAAKSLLSPWKAYSPSLRAQTLDLLLTRALWTRQLVEALDAKQIPANEIDTPRRQRLLQHNEPAIREIAAKVFAASSNPNRGKLVDEYILTLPEKADAKRGQKLFAKVCASCHKIGDVGQQVGPDLLSVGDKSVNGLIVAILDPNRSVEARYVDYRAVTKDGRTLTGMIATETSTSVTLVGVDGKSHALLRTDIEELTSTGKSVMPEGLEKDLPPQEMADLIAFLRGSFAKEQKEESAGTTPKNLNRRGAETQRRQREFAEGRWDHSDPSSVFSAPLRLCGSNLSGVVQVSGLDGKRPAIDNWGEATLSPTREVPMFRRFALAPITLALLATLAQANEPTTAIRGQYVEARNCDVWTGPCFANADFNLTGKNAVMAWRVESGTVDGVKLDGLGIVAVVIGHNTLGLDQNGPAKAVLIVDSRANAEQKTALIAMAKGQAKTLLANVSAVQSATIKLDMCECKNNACAILDAGVAKVKTRCIDGEHDKVCGNETAFYPPLARDVRVVPAAAEEHVFRGTGLGQTWSDSDRRGAYVGTFEIR